MRLRFNIFIPALGAMILIITGIAWVQSASTVSPDPKDLVNRCASCHQMEQEVVTWQQGSHKDVACTACHAPPGLWGWVHQQAAGARMEWIAFTNGEGVKSQVSAEVANDRCIACHARQMPFVMQDITPPALDARAPVPRQQLQFMPATAGHDLHLAGQPQSKCTDCHAGTSHGPRPGVSEHRDAFHNTCQDCHDQKQVQVSVAGSVSCTACHMDLARVTPDDHKGDWRKGHGQAATAKTCGECHLADSAGPHGKLARPTAFPVKAGQAADACAACHQVPMPHPQGWIERHSTQFRQGPAVCAQCHGTGGQGFNLKYAGNPAELPNTPVCQTCHQVPLPHPAGYIAGHGQEALKLGAGTCAQCHGPQNRSNPGAKHAAPDFCTSCHAGVAQPHGQGFLAQHGQEARQAGSEACATCHSPANQARPSAPHAAAGYCAGCHAGVQMPHGRDFLAGHDEAAIASGSAVCATCHSPSNPIQPAARHAAADYCAACHDAYRHPAGWVAAHGTGVTQACSTCHSEQPTLTTRNGNACSACHQGKTWHPQYWFVTHGQAVLAQGEGSCLKCHAYVQPSCAQCHRNR